MEKVRCRLATLSVVSLIGSFALAMEGGADFAVFRDYVSMRVGTAAEALTGGTFDPPVSLPLLEGFGAALLTGRLGREAVGMIERFGLLIIGAIQALGVAMVIENPSLMATPELTTAVALKALGTVTAAGALLIGLHPRGKGRNQVGFGFADQPVSAAYRAGGGRRARTRTGRSERPQGQAPFFLR